MKQNLILILGLLITIGCASHPKNKQPTAAPLEYISHILVVPVRVNDAITTKFVLDTGVGLNLISKSLCNQLNCTVMGYHTGKRMSGQELTVPLSKVDSLTLASETQKNVQVGVFDLGGFPPEFSDIGGFLSLNFFEHTPFTIDYKNKVVIIETSESLERRRQAGKVVRLIMDRDRESLGAYMMMNLPTGATSKMEVDTGSDSLILDERFMRHLGFKANDSRLKKVKGKDETNHTYIRYFGQLKGKISAVGAEEWPQENPKVMFQKIIYDGLVGHSFFQNYTVTYNLTNAEIILARPD